MLFTTFMFMPLIAFAILWAQLASVLPIPVISLLPSMSLSMSLSPFQVNGSQTTQTTPSSSPSVSAFPSLPSQSSSNPKYVVAHHMVGNTAPYTQQDWSDDMQLASQSGIDGFALNVGKDDFIAKQVDNAYQAAQKYNPNFKLFLSLDMTSLPCSSTSDAQALRDMVQTYAEHSNQLRYNNLPLVSTFAGENCAFGQSNAAEGWKTQFARHPDLSGKITFVPSFFVDPSKFVDFKDVMDGDFNWNAGWPTDLTTDKAKTLLSDSPAGSSNSTRITNLVGNLSNGTSPGTELDSRFSNFIGSMDSDQQHLSSLLSLDGKVSRRDTSRRMYMAPVSPWFFTHFPPETFNKNFMFLADQHLYNSRWENLIASRESVDIVQIVTWNDVGESSYIGPVKGAQPEGSNEWVDGMSHTGFLNLTKYYSEAFKSGKTPEIANDQIVMWSRPHSVNAQAPDPIGQPKNFELTEDRLWAVAILQEPSTVKLSTSATNEQTMDLPRGLHKLSIPISAGDFMSATVQRNAETVLQVKPKDFVFNGSPKNYNFNAFCISVDFTQGNEPHVS